MTFEEFGLSEDVMRGLDAMNFKEATPVQEQTIPVILQKRDLIACAQTGTGKTAAYILPLLNLLTEKQGDGDRVRAVIVAPTRELAQQIDMQFEGFSYFLPISTVVVSGGGDGASWDQQKRGLTMGADIIIATPGRLISHLNISNIDFSGVECFILDEADRMLDMGFYDDIMKIGKKSLFIYGNLVREEGSEAQKLERIIYVHICQNGHVFGDYASQTVMFS